MNVGRFFIISFVAFAFLCDYIRSSIAQTGAVAINLSEAVSKDFSMDGTHKCRILFSIDNKTKYHIDAIRFSIGDWQNPDLKGSDIPANYKSDLSLEIPLNDKDSIATCANLATFVINHMSSARAMTCAMPGIAEGDCQAMVEISTTFNNQTVEQLRKAEIAGVRTAKKMADHDNFCRAANRQYNERLNICMHSKSSAETRDGWARIQRECEPMIQALPSECKDQN
jgi:hypothetical protein